MATLTDGAANRDPPWVAMIKWRRIIPPLSKCPSEIAYRGPLDNELCVMPRGPRTIVLVELDGLPIAHVLEVIAPPVT